LTSHESLVIHLT